MKITATSTTRLGDATTTTVLAAEFEFDNGGTLDEMHEASLRLLRAIRESASEADVSLPFPGVMPGLGDAWSRLAAEDAEAG